MIQYILMGAQAAGMITDYVGVQQQKRMGRLGADLDRAVIDTNIETAAMQTEQDSVNSLRMLRQTIASQAAIFAARGVRAGAGSAAGITNDSISRQKADERIRRINLLTKQSELRAQSAMVGMHQLASESQLGRELGKRMFNTISSGAIGEAFKSGK